MSATPWFDKLDRADDFLAAVVGSVNARVRAVGSDAWNYGPEHDQARVRAVRILVRAVNRREREIRHLVAASPVPAPDSVVRARLRARSEARSRAF